MARIKGISQKVSPVDTLKLLALFFDAIILLASTGDDLRKCDQGVSSSSNPWHSSTLVIVLSFAASFFIFGLAWLIVKWCTDIIHYCNRSTKKKGHVSCSFSETAGEGKCICCECPTDERNQCFCNTCPKVETKMCLCNECVADENSTCRCCNRKRKYSTNTRMSDQLHTEANDEESRQHNVNEGHICSRGECRCCGRPRRPDIRNNNDSCNCPSTKEKCHKCIRLITYVAYDVISIIMGVLFLIGDNLTDDICVFYHCGNFHVNSTTCKLLKNQTNPVEGMDLTYNDCTNNYSTTCRRASVACLGISIILNLFLLYLNFKSIYDKSLPSIGKDHKRWMATFNLLTLVIIFDQTITGLYQSVFKFTKNESNMCSDLQSVHLSAGFTFGTSVVVWILILMFHCYTHWPGQGDCKSVSGFIAAVFFLLLFYIPFIFADTPWPWECFDTNDWYISFRKCGIILRLFLAALSVALIILFGLFYIGIVLTPALCVKMKGGLTLDNETDVPDIIRKLPRWKSIPIERRKLINNDSEERVRLLFTSEYEEDMISASYKVSINKDYDWHSALRCKNQNTQGTGTTQPSSSDTQGTGTTQPPSPDTQGTGTTQPSLPDTQGTGTTQPPSSDTQGTGTTQPPSPDTQGTGTTQPPLSDTQGTGTTQPPSSDTQGTGTTQPPSSDTQGTDTMQPPSPDTQGTGTTQPPSSDTQGTGTTQPPSSDPQGTGTTQPPLPDTQGTGTTQPPSSDPQGTGTTQPPSSDPQGTGTTQPPLPDTQGTGTTQPPSSDPQGTGTTQPPSSDPQGTGTTQPPSSDPQGTGTTQPPSSDPQGTGTTQPPSSDPQGTGTTQQSSKYQAVMVNIDPKIDQILPGTIVFGTNGQNGPNFLMMKREPKIQDNVGTTTTQTLSSSNPSGTGTTQPPSSANPSST